MTLIIWPLIIFIIIAVTRNQFPPIVRDTCKCESHALKEKSASEQVPRSLNDVCFLMDVNPNTMVPCFCSRNHMFGDFCNFAISIHKRIATQTPKSPSDLTLCHTLDSGIALLCLLKTVNVEDVYSSGGSEDKGAEAGGGVR